MKRLRIVELSKTYRRRDQGGTVTPVNAVSIDVDAEEMLVLLGPSGCGKTTLLRCVAGLEHPDEGEIFVNDELVFSSRKKLFVPPERRPISMVFQSYALWPHMTVFDNVAYPLRARGMDKGSIRTRVGDKLEVLGLAGLERQFPAQLSGGQQQRVALARAIVRETGIILFDEPLSNVDAVVREQLREELVNMQARFGFSGLYVTHDQVEAMAVGNRIAVLNAGVLEQIGSPREIYDRPASRSVGSFIGAANIFEGVIADADGADLQVDTEVGRLSVARVVGTARRQGQKVTLMVRPESMVVSAGPPDGAANKWQAEVQRRLYLGTHLELTVKVGGKPFRVCVYGGAPQDSARVWLSAAASSIRIIEVHGDPAPAR